MAVGARARVAPAGPQAQGQPGQPGQEAQGSPMRAPEQLIGAGGQGLLEGDQGEESDSGEAPQAQVGQGGVFVFWKHVVDWEDKH